MKRRLKERLWIVTAVATSLGVVATSPVLTPVARATPTRRSPVRVTVTTGTINLQVHDVGPSTHEFDVDLTNDDAAAAEGATQPS
jgi:hypothetical protein